MKPHKEVENPGAQVTLVTSGSTGVVDQNRRGLLRTAAGLIITAAGFRQLQLATPAHADGPDGPRPQAPAVVVGRVPWENGKYQTFPRHVDEAENIISMNLIDLGTLGPDVDTIFGIDFRGRLSTGALVVHMPASGNVLETRVVGIKRTDLETVQFRPALGGDRFDIFRVSEHGGDAVLDAMARLHAQNTAREHQLVIYIGDLGLFERQWPNERPFLNSIIRAQRPEMPNLGIIRPDFVSPRQF